MLTCQQIARDNSRWTQGTIACREQWMRCLNALKDLEEQIVSQRRQRRRMATIFSVVSVIITVSTNVLTASSAIFPSLLKISSPVLSQIISAVGFVVSMLAWFKVKERAMKFALQEDDLIRAQKFSRQVRDLLSEALGDNIIDRDEQEAINDAFLRLSQMSEEIGHLGRFQSQMLAGGCAENEMIFQQISEQAKAASSGAENLKRQFPQLRQSLEESRMTLRTHGLPPPHSVPLMSSLQGRIIPPASEFITSSRAHHQADGAISEPHRHIAPEQATTAEGGSGGT